MKSIFHLLHKWSESSLVLRIFIGLVVGTILGLMAPSWTAISILGKIFVSLLKAIAPVLVAVLVLSSISHARDGLGPRFRLVVFYYLLSTFMAALLAVTGSFLFPVRLELEEVASSEALVTLHDVFDNLLTNMVSNPLHSITTANYIGILF